MDAERCAECGFDGTRLTEADAVTALRSLGRRWRELFEGVDEDLLRARPAQDVWSPLEYAAHTRDVIALNSRDMTEALKGDNPSFPAIEPDKGAPDHGYNALDPKTVLGELAANAERMAARAEKELPDHWSRTATVGEETLEAGWIFRHAVHDATHHLRDVEKQLDR